MILISPPISSHFTLLPHFLFFLNSFLSSLRLRHLSLRNSTWIPDSLFAVTFYGNFSGYRIRKFQASLLGVIYPMLLVSKREKQLIIWSTSLVIYTCHCKTFCIYVKSLLSFVVHRRIIWNISVHYLIVHIIKKNMNLARDKLFWIYWREICCMSLKKVKYMCCLRNLKNNWDSAKV